MGIFNFDELKPKDYNDYKDVLQFAHTPHTLKDCILISNYLRDYQIHCLYNNKEHFNKTTEFKEAEVSIQNQINSHLIAEAATPKKRYVVLVPVICTLLGVILGTFLTTLLQGSGG